MIRDIRLTANGDIATSSLYDYNDISLCYDYEMIKQGIESRLKTALGDFALWREYGHELDKYLGTRNTSATISQLKQEIIKCIGYGDLLKGYSIEINALPVDKTKIGLKISITNIDNQAMSYVFNLLINLDDVYNFISLTEVSS